MPWPVSILASPNKDRVYGFIRDISTMNTLDRTSTCGIEKRPANLLSDNNLGNIA